MAGGVPQAFTEFVRAQLGVAPQFADHVRSALPKWRAGIKGDLSHALSLSLPLALLATGALPPKLARRWERMQLAQLLCALPGAAADALRAELFPSAAATDSLSPEALARLTAALDARGWDIPADPLGAALYGALVRGQWDDLDESSGTPVDEAAGLFVSMRRLWAPLGLGQMAHDAHCVFSAVQRWVVGGSLDALRLARCVLFVGPLALSLTRVSCYFLCSRIAKELASALSTNAALPAAEATHVRLTLSPVASRGAVLLEDYHVQFRRGGDESFALWIDIACDVRAALAALAGSAPEGGLVAGMLCKSLTAAYMRCRENALKSGADADGSNMAALARGTQDLLDAEAKLFTPALEQREPAAACTGATHLQQLFASDLRSWLRSVKGVEQALPGLKASESLVARLQSCAIGGAAGEPPPPIDIAALAEPLAQAWVTARVAQSTQWMERALSLERWDTTATPDSGTTSAIDLVRAANEAADAFFSFKLQQAGPARALAQGVASTLTGYAKALLRQLGDPAKHIPPVPPLTRYKQAAMEVLLQEHARSGGDEQRVVEITPTVDQLMAMHSSLTFIIRELPATEHSIQRQWLALARCPGSTLRRGPCDMAPVTGIFSETSRVLSEARLTVLAHVSHSIVFGHLRRQFVEKAYLFGTKNPDARLPVTLLEPLNAWMARVCGSLSDDDRNEAAAAIMAAALRGVRFVLLNGGPVRTFLQDDCDALEADLEALRDFFVADGEGLPPEQVSEALVPVSRLLDAMAQDTHHLIALHDSTSATAWDKDTLLRILCHRGDRTSSKYLKQKLHTPKPIGFIEEKRQILSAMAHGRPH